MIKAIFWDNDGVLVDTEHLYYEATRQILNSIGINLNINQYVDLFLKQSGGAWHLVQDKGFSKDQINNFKIERNELYGQMLEKQSNVIDGVIETLDYLYPKYFMAIVTSSKRKHFDIIHQNSGLLQYFDFVIANEDYINSKPDPEPYLLAVKKSGYINEECVVIEDSERGLKSAKAAGLSCFVIPTQLTKNNNFVKADKILSNVKDIMKLL
ncbi:MAG: HAD family phosphatase [Ignavibacteriae bacterium]|nr:HAD family phosphatase [Ignavibacteriota bacterium]